MTTADLPRLPAADRNCEPITAVLAARLPARGRVLEVASGMGQHVAHWCGRFTDLEWQPSETAADRLAAIEAWRHHAARPNFLKPVAVDLGARDWPTRAPGPWDAVVAVNLLHISPWLVTLALLEGCSRVLAPGGRLFVYGPFAANGVLQPQSNVDFDRWLRAENGAWGVRDLDDIESAASPHDLVLEERIAMPANNQVLVIGRRAHPGTG